MTSSRRDFLKIAGVSALTLMTPAILRPARVEGKTTAGALTAKRWAMAVDPLKCPAGCTDCITACHTVHNVPNFGNPKDEVKWIWQEPFAAAFQGENHLYLGKPLQEQII